MGTQLETVGKKSFHDLEELFSIESTPEAFGFGFDAPSVCSHPLRAA